MLTLLGLFLATFVSEDAALVAAGLLVQSGEVAAPAAIAACAIGIFLGDLGVWAIGRTGGRLLDAWPWLGRRLISAGAGRLRAWLDRSPARAIVTSRFVPGSRLPLYFAAGVVGMPIRRFAPWTAFSVAIWTPALVLTSAWAGDKLHQVLPSALASRPGLVLAGLVMSILATRLLIRRVLAARLHVAAARAVGRWRRWEFWPSWLFYLPVAVWVAVLAIRYRGFGAVAAANPGIPGGGVVGESKFDILTRLPAEWTIPSARVAEGLLAWRRARARAAIASAGWTGPLVLKPDVGQRGVGVRLVQSLDEVDRYLAAADGAVLIQPHHPGPHEAGIFYARHPDEPRGRILAITDKRFPHVTGDGRSTLAELIEGHPRYRLQAALFLRRHRRSASVVLAAGEVFALTVAGNHAQGAVFLDGRALWTPELEARVDAIARAYPGFFIGRFDVRYGDLARFRAGEDLAIVELNGATGEPTSIYDPDGSLLDAYRALFRQWSLVFRIGDANRRAGAARDGGAALFDAVRAHLRRRTSWDALD